MKELILILFIIFTALYQWIFSYYRFIGSEVRRLPFFSLLFKHERNAKRGMEILDRIWFSVYTVLLLYYLVILEHEFMRVLGEYLIISFLLIITGLLVGRFCSTYLSIDLMKKLSIAHLWGNILFVAAVLPVIISDKKPGKKTEDSKNHVKNSISVDKSFPENLDKSVIPIPDWEDIIVKEIMVPRIEIEAIKDGATLEELYAVFSGSKYSRIPVYSKDIDNIIGIVTLKDFLTVWSEEKKNELIAPLVRPVLFVPETKRITTMLKDFKENQVSIAVVLNEYGGTAGLLTVHDIMENIIGEIKDEYDVAQEEGIMEVEGHYYMNGKMDIEIVQETLGVEIEEGDYETISGYIFSLLGRVPFTGEKIKTTDLIIEIIAADKRKISRLRIRKTPK